MITNTISHVLCLLQKRQEYSRRLFLKSCHVLWQLRDLFDVTWSVRSLALAADRQRLSLPRHPLRDRTAIVLQVGKSSFFYLIVWLGYVYFRHGPTRLQVDSAFLFPKNVSTFTRLQTGRCFGSAAHFRIEASGHALESVLGFSAPIFLALVTTASCKKTHDATSGTAG